MDGTGSPPWARTAWDVVLGAGCATIAVAVHLSGSEAVAANADPGLLSVVLTLLATTPLVVRHRFPLPVLAVTLGAVLVLVATRNTVGMSTLGFTIAFYTAVATGPRRQAVTALGLLAVGLVGGMLLRPVDLSAEGATVNAIVLVGAGVLAAGVRDRREAVERERRRAQAAREEAARSTVEERLRITRELHDILGHAMSVMVVQAGVAERLLESRPDDARRAVAEIAATGRRSLGELRQALGVLRDGDPASPLPREPAPSLAALPALVDRVRAAGLPVDLSVGLTAQDLPAGLDLAAYRVVQEALTNCLKHAGASRASVVVDGGPTQVRVQVRDDGVGARPDSTEGSGLTGMRERVAVYEGTLSAGPADGGGFRVDATFPVPVRPRPEAVS